MGEPTVWDRGPGNHPGRAGVPLLPAPKGPVTPPGTSVPQEAASPALLSFTSHREHLSNTFSPNSSIGFPRGVLGERRRRRGAEAPAPQGLLLSPWEDAHGGFNARTGRQGTPRATEVRVPWSPPPYAPAPPPSLLRPERTDPSPVSPLSSAHSLASTYRPRHTHGPWCPSLPPPVLLPALYWPIPVSSVKHTSSSRKSAWTAGDSASLVCVSTTSTLSGEGPRGRCRSPLRAALPCAAGTTHVEGRQPATTLHHRPACAPLLEERERAVQPLAPPLPNPAAGSDTVKASITTALSTGHLEEP